MTQHIERYVVRGSSTLTAPVMEILDAEIDGMGGLTVWCEIDDSFPSSERTFYLVSEGQYIPTVERPTRVNVKTMGSDEEQWIDGPPVLSRATFVRRLRTNPSLPALFLYETVR